MAWPEKDRGPTVKNVVMERTNVAEQEPLTPERVRELGSRMKGILELNGSPVGVRLLFSESNVPAGARSVTHHRY